MSSEFEKLREKIMNPNPRPWALAYRDRGLGHGDYGVMDARGDLVVGHLDREIAELIVNAVAAYKEAGK